MELLEHALGHLAVGVFDNIIDAAKMVGGLDHVVYFDVVIFLKSTDGVGLVNVSGLVLGEAASFDMIGIISEFYLELVVNAALGAKSVFAAEDLEEGKGLIVGP